MNLGEFLAWEARQELKHEFDGIRPIAMARGTLAHGRIQRNLAISAGGRLRGERCEFIGSGANAQLANHGFMVIGPIRECANQDYVNSGYQDAPIVPGPCSWRSRSMGAEQAFVIRAQPAAG